MLNDTKRAVITLISHFQRLLETQFGTFQNRYIHVTYMYMHI